MLEVEGGYYKYRPQSDYCIVVNKLLVLILEVSSDTSEQDKNWMKLQAASLIRLGNLMIKSSLLTYIVMVIYITNGMVTLPTSIPSIRKLIERYLYSLHPLLLND